MTRTLDRIRVWANANWNPWWNLIGWVAMVAMASYVYVQGAYREAAMAFACANMLPLGLAILYCLRAGKDVEGSE